MQLACAALIGICAGLVLHGTSSFVFVLLGVDASQKPSSDRELPALDDEEEQDWDESDTRLGDSSSRVSTTSFFSRRSVSKKEKDDTNDMFEKQWKLLRPSEKPKRRRRGLLAQTIHEESSSDLS